jgi:hypothetical protein
MVAKAISTALHAWKQPGADIVKRAESSPEADR